MKRERYKRHITKRNGVREMKRNAMNDTNVTS